MKKCVVIILVLLIFFLVGCVPREASKVVKEDQAVADDFNLDGFSDEELDAILVNNGSSLTDGQKVEILQRAYVSKDKALSGKSFVSFFDFNNPGAVQSRWTIFLSEAQRVRELRRCTNSFKTNSQIYQLVEGAFPGQNKVRVYDSWNAPKGLTLPANFERSKIKRQIVLRNDLASGESDAEYGTYWNTVVRVLLSTTGTIPIDPQAGNGQYCVSPGESGDAIDPGGNMLAYSVEKKDYRLTVGTGMFISNPFATGILTCSPTQIQTLEDEIAEEEFGYEEFNTEASELSCTFLSGSSCLLWRIYQTATNPSHIREVKGFYEDVANHCQGMTLDITLSAVLPDGDDYCAEELDDVWGCIS